MGARVWAWCAVVVVVLLVAAWVGYMAVFAASARVVLSWRRNVSVGLLSIAVLAFLVSEVFYGQELVQRTRWAGRPGLLRRHRAVRAAALHPSMRDLASPADARPALGRGG